jgi:hypothetical protein
MLTQIAMEELGITAALDCFTTGDLGACGETAINVASSFVGGMAGKLASKYGLPWNWGKGVALGKRVWNNLDDLVGGAMDWFKHSRKAKELERACARSNSFVPGTLVLLADGTYKAIDEVDVGDKVVATDPETVKQVAKTVVATIIGVGSKNLVEITVGAAGAANVLVATHNHPFWVPSAGAWVDATHLKPGDVLQTPSGPTVRVQTVRRWTQPARVHNLTVEDIHTYYVMAGNTPVLVHNTNGPCGTGGIGNGPAPENAWNTLNHIDQNGAGPAGYGLPKWQGKQRPYSNDGRDNTTILPRANANGDAITYHEYDVNPFVKGQNRGGERLVVGTDGSAYYTGDHYFNWIQLR